MTPGARVRVATPVCPNSFPFRGMMGTVLVDNPCPVAPIVSRSSVRLDSGHVDWFWERELEEVSP